MKICTDCKQEKPLEDFSPRKNRPTDTASHCKDCKAARERRRRAELGEEYLQSERLRGAVRWQDPGYRAWHANRMAKAHREQPRVRIANNLRIRLRSALKLGVAGG